MSNAALPPDQNRAIDTMLWPTNKRATSADLAADLGHECFLLESLHI